VFLSGTILMAYNLTMTIKGRKTLQVRPPEVPA
jgi:cbb3-type cytochrome oxidase subunit 1